MARILKTDRYWDRVGERNRRLAKAVRAAWNVSQEIYGFIDYWPDIPGTIPEKMVLAWLIENRISLSFAHFIGDIPGTPTVERFRPDFILTDYNIVIEVAGSYWHSRPGMFEYDANRALLLTQQGYNVKILVDLDIMEDVDAAIKSKIPELWNPPIRGNEIEFGNRIFDPTASIRSRLKQWPKINAVRYRAKTVNQYAIVASWMRNRRPRATKPDRDPIFTHEVADLQAILDEFNMANFADLPSEVKLGISARGRKLQQERDLKYGSDPRDRKRRKQLKKERKQRL